MSDLPDILLFMTDQHTPYYSGWYGHNVDTPNMDALVKRGTSFDEAYTVCPLCVPSRMAFLSAQRPARTGVFDNSDSLSDLTPTFLHYLVAQGYETVLVGRMHFVGQDQRHGFTKRIAPDCTTITWNRQDLNPVRGVYEPIYGGYRMTNVVGGGDSNSGYYDQVVINTALDYLRQDHEKPQFLCVSIYSPHHPYVAPRELYEKYKKRVALPANFDSPIEPEIWRFLRKNEVSRELALDIQAAYCAMVEKVDGQLGTVEKAFADYCERNHRKQLVIYMSDHGDTVGDRNCYGKQSFYEKSIKIPVIFAGDGVQENQRVAQCISIMDIGPTILDHTCAASMRNVDGVSLAAVLRGGAFPDHPVYAEGMYGKGFRSPLTDYAFMLKEDRYKYCCFSDEAEELLYDTVDDPEERNNLIGDQKSIASAMREKAAALRKDREAKDRAADNAANRKLWRAYEKAAGSPYDQSDRFQGPVPESYRELPEELSPYVTSIPPLKSK